MKDILEEIVANTRTEVAQFKEAVPPAMLYSQVEDIIGSSPLGFLSPTGGSEGGTGGASMREALLSSKTGIIAEFKRKSPSKGWIKEDGRADVIPLSYQQNGAAALSILADRKFFGGCDEFIAAARQSGVTIPILYKNFIIDEYQLYQARLCGASAVLLIAADLSLQECKTLILKAHELGLEVLLEMHSREELDYAQLEPDMYGINNRNLGTFITSVENSFRMAELLPKDVCKVSESGISNVGTIRELKEVGYSGFLIGECFMKTADPGQALRQFIIHNS